MNGVQSTGVGFDLDEKVIQKLDEMEIMEIAVWSSNL
jgi:hypothetical protein